MFFIWQTEETLCCKLVDLWEARLSFAIEPGKAVSRFYLDWLDDPVSRLYCKVCLKNTIIVNKQQIIDKIMVWLTTRHLH